MTPGAWATLVLAVSNVLVGVLIGWNLYEARMYRRMNALMKKDLERQAEERVRDWLQRRGK